MFITGIYSIPGSKRIGDDVSSGSIRNASSFYNSRRYLFHYYSFRDHYGLPLGWWWWRWWGIWGIVSAQSGTWWRRWWWSLRSGKLLCK